MKKTFLILTFLFWGFGGMCPAQSIIEGFNSPTFPPFGWRDTVLSGNTHWTGTTNGSHPDCVPYNGPGMACFDAFHSPTGSAALLISPAVIPTENGWTVSFYFYRNDLYKNFGDYPDSLHVYANTTQSLTSATHLISIGREFHCSPVVTAEGWYEYSVVIPDAFINQTTYILFKGTSGYRGDLYLDEVIIAPPSSCPKIRDLNYSDLTGNEVSLSWTDSNSGSEWVVNIENQTHPENSRQEVVHSNPSTVQVEPNCLYSVSIQTICEVNDTSFTSNTISFTTPQIPADIPFFCDFEQSTTPNEWTRNNNVSDNGWYIGSAVNNTQGGNQSLYISADNGVSNVYRGNQCALAVAYRDIMFGDAPEYSICFDWRAQGEGKYSDFFKALLTSPQHELLGGTPYSANSNFYSSANDFTDVLYSAYPEETATINGSSDWQHTSVNISGDSVRNKIRRLAFVWHNDSFGTFNPPAAIDNIEIKAVYCATPKNLTLDNLNANTVSWTWSDNARASFWTVVLKDTTNNITTTETTTTNSIDFFNLSANTTYSIKIQAGCQDEESSFSTIQFFTTPCDILPLPYQQNFETTEVGSQQNTTLPSCWNFISDATHSNAYAYVSDDDNFEGVHSFKMFLHRDDLTSPCYAALISPQFSEDLSQIEVSFHAKQDNYIGNNYQQYLRIGYTTNPYDANNFVIVDTVKISSAFQHYTCSFDTVSASPNNSYVVIAIDPFTTRTGNIKHCIYLDNVNVSLTSDCPTIESPTLNTITSNSVNITYELPNGVNDIAVQYRRHGEEDWTETSASYSPFLLENLNAATNYELRIAGRCITGSIGNWTVPIRFRTKQIAATVPYLCSFEDETETQAWDILNGNSISGWIIGDSVHHGDSGKSLFISTNGIHNVYDHSTYSTVVAYRELNFPTAGEYEISFDWRCAGEENEDFFKVLLLNDSITMKVGMMAYPWASANETAYVIAKNANKSYFQGNAEWISHTSSFTISSDNNNLRLVFVWRNNSRFGSDPAAAIDNISITPVTCPSPLTVSATWSNDSLVTFSWQSYGNASQWEVNYSNDGETWVSETVSQMQYSFIPNPFQYYQVKVRAICDSNDQSRWSHIYDLAPSCNATVTDFPFTEGFNQGLGCFRNLSLTGNTQWMSIADKLLMEQMEGARCAIFSQFGDGDQAMLISPTMNLSELTNPVLKFHAISPEWVNVTDSWQVMYRTHPDSIWNILHEQVASLEEWTPFCISLPNASNQYQFAFKATSNFGRGVGIDALSLQDSTTECMTPANLTVSDITENSAKLNWEEQGTASRWRLSWKTNSNTIWQDSVVTNQHITWNCSPATTYQVKIKSLCGADNSSEWSEVVTFTTECNIATSPYFEDFDQRTLSESCWRCYHGKTQNSVTNKDDLFPTDQGWEIAPSDMGIHENHVKVTLQGNNTSEWLISPEIELRDSMELSFILSYTANDNITSHQEETDDKLMVFISTDGGNSWHNSHATTWTNAPESNFSLQNLASGGQTFKIPLSAYDGVIKIAFYAESTSGTLQNVIHLDKIKVAKTNIVTKGNVETLTPTQLSSSSFKMKGKLLDIGTNAENIKLGFLWTDTEEHPSEEDLHEVVVNYHIGISNFDYVLSNLSPDKTYSYMAFIENEAGKSYGALQRLQLSDLTTITKAQSALLQLIPNPAKEKVNICIDGLKGDAEILLLSINGTPVLQTKAYLQAEHNDIILNVSDLSSGTYQVIIRTKQTQHTGRLIIP